MDRYYHPHYFHVPTHHMDPMHAVLAPAPPNARIPVIKQTIAEDSSGEEEEEEAGQEEEHDGDSTRTIRAPQPDPGRYWSCLTCWRERSSTSDEWCPFCEMSTSTITRSSDTRKPIQADGSEGQDVDTPWICVDCKTPKLFLGGDLADIRIFRGQCIPCGDTTDTVYADRRASFCCAECRHERPNGSERRQVTVNGQPHLIEFWNKWCTQCSQRTETVKLDPANSDRHCCVDCRSDRDKANDDEDEEQWCAFCDAHSETIELDDETEDA